jgi:hypothetical protein
MKRWIGIGILAVLCLGLLFTLRNTDAELASTQTELTSTQAAFTSTQAAFTSTQAELSSTQVELTSTQTELGTTKEELADLQVSYDGLVSGHGYTIKDPTYRQMMKFTKADKTNENEYIEGEYVCENFAMDVCNNAEERGIRCAYVTIDHPDGGHAIVAFNTIDEGLIYIEPQHDDIVNPVIGKHYYKCIVPKPGHYYEKPPYDDTIEKILVIW